MIWFFIALVEIICFGGLVCLEKIKEGEHNQNVARHRNARQSIEERYVDSDIEHWAEDFVRSGQYYKEICELFSDDFEYVFGNDWEDKLKIPQKQLLSPGVYMRAYSIWRPNSHAMWVYHLVLAQKGKIDRQLISHGLPLGGMDDADRNVKFAKCIEKNLIKAGVQDVRLALELETIIGSGRRTPEHLCGGNIVIESLCFSQTCRLWDDD